MLRFKERIIVRIYRILKVVVWTLLVISVCGCSGWQSRFSEIVPEYGHRNWIVVADSAYPKQSASGIETIATGKGQLEVLNVVLEAIDQAPHVQAIVMLDAELNSVPEADAPGVTAYRNALKKALKDKQVKVMPHEDIISQLDKDSKIFNVLLLKTDLTIPYTSVFLQLDCGYWTAEKEKRLRETLSKN